MTTKQPTEDKRSIEEKNSSFAVEDKGMPEETGKTVSRRNFIKGTALAGAGAAAMLQGEESSAHEQENLDIRIPEEIPRTLAEAARPANFPMTGAEVFAKFCSDEGVAGFFCWPWKLQHDQRHSC